MKRQEWMTPPPLGGSALLVIFGVLCLTVFALLSLSTALSQQRLTEGALTRVEAYYKADALAEETFARVRAGETVAGVTRDGAVYRYSCAISDSETLEVELRREGDTWTVLRWQTVVYSAPLEEHLNVWSGETHE